MGEDVEWEKFRRPDDIGVSKMGQEVVGSEFGFVWEREGGV